MAELMIIEDSIEDRYFAVKNTDDMARVALKILLERYEEGIYPSLTMIEKNRQESIEWIKSKYIDDLLNVSDTDFAKLSDFAKNNVERERSNYARSLKKSETAFNEDQHFAECIEKLMSVSEEEAVQMLIDKNDQRSNLALYTLDLRCDYVGENYRMEFTEEF